MNASQQIQRSLDGLIAKLPSEESRRSYRQDWARWSEWLKETHLDVRKVKPRDVEAHLAQLQEGEYAKSTIGRALSVIRVVYGAFVRDELMAVNPAREVTTPRMSAMPRTPWLDKEQIKLMLNVPAETWQDRRDRVVFFLLFGLGWRRSEIARMRLERAPEGDTKFSIISLEKKTVHGILKGGKEETVGVPAWVMTAVEEWVKFASIPPAGALFPRWDDDPTPISGPMLYKLVKRMARRAGLPKDKVTPHGCRRSFITLGDLMNVPLKELQAAVAHSSINTTERYKKVNEAASKAPGQVFAGFLKKDE